ncbi:hypothetical protein H5410_019667 [Solanum commersonii]|uniref:Bet v I/Major latex protein domain-containing protein n=1 Tax=Solanum commersonii TaxID=4109 RepID=A0A9J5Z6Y0_SOLCO|nr:hypothetical protein H5410_019667 [Solanum commersonii]
MSLEGKLVSEINIKCDGDVFHEIFRQRPYHISSMCDKVQNVNIHEGEWGTVGSIISWNFIHDGKEKVAKDIVEVIDEEKKVVKMKLIGEDILEEYKSLSFTAHVESKGEWGVVGSVIFWNFTLDGKEKVSKHIVVTIDEEKKLVKFKVIEGDILEEYKSCSFTVHVESKGENNLVTWIIEYEKKNANVPDPHTYMELCLNISKDIETHHLK